MPFTVCAMMTVGRPFVVAGPGQLVGAPDLAVVVAVDLDHAPAEGLEHGGQVDPEPRIATVAAVGQRRLGGGRQAELLETVAVDDRRQVRQLVPRRDLDRLPDHAFLDLSVTQHHPGMEVLLAQLGPKRHADPDRQALTQRTG